MNGGVVDVLVAGGGPAGARVALDLARSGWRVVVVERAAMPRYKTCGGGVVGRARRWLPDGLERCFERDCHVAELRVGDAGAFRVERATPIVSMAMRAAFDAALFEAARAAGAEVRSPCAVTGLRDDGERVRIATSQGEIAARFVVAADGAASRTALAAGWTARPGCVPALEWEVEVSPADHARFTARAVFDFAAVPGGYAWVFPKRRHLSIGALQTRRGAGDLRARLRDWIAALGLQPLQLEEHGALLPVRPRPGGCARGRVLLAGDAAGFADPLTGEGISFALASGALAAGALIAGGGDPRRVAHIYTASVQDEIGRELRASRLLARLLYSRPGLRGVLFRRGGQALCEAMCDVVAGRTTARALLASPAAWRGLVRVGLRPARAQH